MLTVFAFIVLFMSVKFVCGTAKNKALLEKLNVESSLATKAGIMSVGFILATLVSVIPVGVFRWLLTPVPIVILLCVPGLIVLRTLGLKLERTGIDIAKPALEWVDQGKIAGWLACGLCVVSWAFSTLPFMLGSITTG